MNYSKAPFNACKKAYGCHRMLKLHFYNHKTLRHLTKQSLYHCCKCCLCKAYSPDTFQTHLV